MGLVALFDGISAFVGYLMPKHNAKPYKGFHTFPQSLSLKVNNCVTGVRTRLVWSCNSEFLTITPLSQQFSYFSYNLYSIVSFQITILKIKKITFI